MQGFGLIRGVSGVLIMGVSDVIEMLRGRREYEPLDERMDSF